MYTYVVLHSIEYSVDLQILHLFQAVAQQHSKGIFIYCTFSSVHITVFVVNTGNCEYKRDAVQVSEMILFLSIC